MADEKADETSQAPEPTSVSDQELQAAFDGAAFHSNKVLATMTLAGVRIAFMEQLADVVQPVFRTAVFLTYPDAIALRDLLVRQLEKVEVTIEQRPSPKEKDGG